MITDNILISDTFSISFPVAGQMLDLRAQVSGIVGNVERIDDEIEWTFISADVVIIQTIDGTIVGGVDNLTAENVTEDGTLADAQIFHAIYDTLRDEAQRMVRNHEI